METVMFQVLSDKGEGIMAPKAGNRTVFIDDMNSQGLDVRRTKLLTVKPYYGPPLTWPDAVRALAPSPLYHGLCLLYHDGFYTLAWEHRWGGYAPHITSLTMVPVREGHCLQIAWAAFSL
jgi:hypothetical protein